MDERRQSTRLWAWTAAVAAAVLLVSLWAVSTSRGAAVRTAAPVSQRSCPERTLDRLSLAQKVGQLFIVGVDPVPTTPQLRLIAGRHIGSVLLAHDSEAGVRKTRTRTDRLQSAATTGGVGQWVAVDQEGGFVQHLRGPGFSTIPTALTQGTWSAHALRARAETWGAQLRRAGANLDLAPVADTVSRTLGTRNRPIGYYFREYGHRPAIVARHALAVRSGMRAAHVQTTAKHFPGLGRVLANTDTTYGVTDRVTRRHGDPDLRPFRALVDDDIPVVMVSSVRYTRIDPAHIGPMSPAIIRGMLRHDLGFGGTIVSDSLTAAALSHVPVRLRALRFLQAGGDLALVGNSSAAAAMVRTVLEHAGTQAGLRLVDHAALQVLRTKNRQGLLPCSPASAPGPATG